MVVEILKYRGKIHSFAQEYEDLYKFGDFTIGQLSATF